MPLAWCLFVVSWAFSVGSAVMSSRHSDREAVEVLAVAGAGTVIFFSRWLVRSEGSLHGALVGASMCTVLILVITRGRPARMFDPKQPDARDLPLSEDEERARRRQKGSVRIH